MAADFPNFHLPTKPYTIVDAVNRRAAATGSSRNAIAVAGADYNGHRLTLEWNDFRRYYVGEYHWGERVIFVRSADFSEAIRASKFEFARQGKGASLVVKPKNNADFAILRADPDFAEGDEPKPAWKDWRFDELSLAVSSNNVHNLLAARDRAHYLELSVLGPKSPTISAHPELDAEKGNTP